MSTISWEQFKRERFTPEQIKEIEAGAQELLRMALDPDTSLPEPPDATVSAP